MTYEETVGEELMALEKNTTVLKTQKQGVDWTTWGYWENESKNIWNAYIVGTVNL